MINHWHDEQDSTMMNNDQDSICVPNQTNTYELSTKEKVPEFNLFGTALNELQNKKDEALLGFILFVLIIDIIQ